MHELTEFMLPLRHSLIRMHLLTSLTNTAIVKINDLTYICIPLFNYDRNKVQIHIATEISPLFRLFNKIKDIEIYDITIEIHFVGFSAFNQCGVVVEIFEKIPTPYCNNWKKPSYGEIYSLVKQKHEEANIKGLRGKRSGS